MSAKTPGSKGEPRADDRALFVDSGIARLAQGVADVGLPRPKINERQDVAGASSGSAEESLLPAAPGYADALIKLALGLDRYPTAKPARALLDREAPRGREAAPQRPPRRDEYVTLSPELVQSLQALARACEATRRTPRRQDDGDLRPLRDRVRSIAGRTAVGMMWAALVWFIVDTQLRTPWFEVLDAVSWVTKTIVLYATTLWIWMTYNIALRRFGSPPRARELREPDRSADYLGRPLVLSSESQFTDSYLVVDIDEGKKTYRAEPVGSQAAVRHAGMG